MKDSGYLFFAAAIVLILFLGLVVVIKALGMIAIVIFVALILYKLSSDMNEQ